jgi:microsomal dipeptidase-like Zn-dependent dipeptidase
VGPARIALGSGFDSFTTPIVVNQLPYLTQAVLTAGHDVAAIKAIMGENAIRFFFFENCLWIALETGGTDRAP